MTSSFVTVRGKPLIDKDPNAELDYTFDWRSWLAVSTPPDTIASYQILLADSPTAVLGAHDEDQGFVTGFVSGGAVGDKIKVTCRVVTTAGRTDDRTVYLKVVER